MISDIQILPNTSELNDLSLQLLDDNKKIHLSYAKNVKQHPWEDFRYFCHKYARYGFPTIELIHYLKGVIRNRKAIEIGAGAGDLGFYLGIKMTDSKQQEKPEVIQAYQNMQQPVIDYPKDVERLEALQAVYKYKPKVVVGSWITTFSKNPTSYASNPWGINEEKILKMVETFILVGNLDVHGSKPILKYPHTIIQGDWIVSRAKNQENNCIIIWDNK